MALILGDNIETTITAELACIGANINAHGTARAHTLFNVIGVMIIITVFPVFLNQVLFVTESIMQFGPPDSMIAGERPNISRYIANSHTLFNVVNAMIFLLVLPYLVKVATLLTPHKKEDQELDELCHIKFLDTKFVDTPSVALAQAMAEIIRMGEVVQIIYDDVINSLRERKLKELSKWRKREDSLDILQREITQFLVKVTQDSISPEESREMRSLLRMVNNLERVGDAVEDVAGLIEKLIEQGLNLSDEGLRDYVDISNEAQSILTLC